jgi:acyl phosphate:glycerol-3-phosphate acyltransferase
MEILGLLLAAFLSYLLGSIPTALVYSRLTHRQDIRLLGDGNMGARNTKRTYGLRSGVLVTLADILKGLLSVTLAVEMGLPLLGQLICGGAAIFGHDFPLFARFKGGQGFATTTGVFLGLFPLVTLIGTAIYFVLFFFTRSSDIAAGVGMGFIAVEQLIAGASIIVLGFIVLPLLFIPFKKWLDRSRVTSTDRSTNHPSHV